MLKGCLSKELCGFFAVVLYIVLWFDVKLNDVPPLAVVLHLGA